MTKSGRVKPIIKVAESKERAAARLFGESQRVLNERELRLQELHSYRADYRQRFDAQAAQGMAAQQLRAFLVFLSKLDEAIAQQQQWVAQAGQDLELKRRLWLEKNIRTRVLDKVREKYVDQEKRQERKVEQKESDEHAQGMSARKKARLP